MADPMPAALRRHFARHNRSVIFLALFTAILVLIFWATIYFAAYWLALLAITVARGADAQAPAYFFQRFAKGAAILCLLAFIARRFSRNEFPHDEKSVPKTAADLLFAVPRATFSVFGTLTACQFLNEHELALAWRLLQKIERDGELNLRSLPVEIPNARLQRKIVLALQLAGLLDLQKVRGEFTLTFHDKKASALCQPPVRIKVAATPRR